MTATPDRDGEAFWGPGPDVVFRRNLAEGRFVIQHCQDCARYVFPPRSLCPACGSTALRTVEASGQGQVHSTSVDRRRPEAGGPVNIALVDLAEGPRMMSRVVGVAPDQVGIGMAVRAEIHGDSGGPLVVFRLVGTG